MDERRMRPDRATPGPTDPAVSEIAHELASVAKGLYWTTPEVRFNELLADYSALLNSTTELERATTPQRQPRSPTPLANLLTQLVTINEQIAYREADSDISEGHSTSHSAGVALRRSRDFITNAYEQVLDALTIASRGYWLYPISGYDPERDRRATPPTIKQLRLMATKGLESAGHGTYTYDQLTRHFDWTPPPAGPVSPLATANFLRTGIAAEIAETYEAEFKHGGGPGPLRWIHSVLTLPCTSCGAGAGAQCRRPNGWRLPAHRSHRARRRDVRLASR